MLDAMIEVVSDLHQGCNVARTMGTVGAPWEFNLRDLLRWCQLAADCLPQDSRCSTGWSAGHCMLMSYACLHGEDKPAGHHVPLAGSQKGSKSRMAGLPSACAAPQPRPPP